MGERMDEDTEDVEREKGVSSSQTRPNLEESVFFTEMCVERKALPFHPTKQFKAPCALDLGRFFYPTTGKGHE